MKEHQARIVLRVGAGEPLKRSVEVFAHRIDLRNLHGRRIGVGVNELFERGIGVRRALLRIGDDGLPGEPIPLRRFPVDKLKIDMAFIRGITTNADDAAIVLAIIRMAQTLKLQVVAEGVESAAQLAYLRAHNCDQIQGYYFSRPLPLPELEKLLLEKQRGPAVNEAPDAALAGPA